MLAFVFSLAFAIEDLKFCVYKKKKELCKSEYGIPVSEKEVEINVTQGGKYLINTYVRVVEDVPKAKLDIHHIKEGNIYVIGIGKRQSIMFVSSKLATYDFIHLENINVVKKDTTQFAIKELFLENTLFTGFEKASTFYGNKLVSDLNSVHDSTFKFNTVLIKVGEPSKFTPNWKVDGAVFCDEVTFDDFGKSPSLFQYGDQFIITPINETMGYRRTNFRPISKSKVSFIVNFANKGQTLTVGSWFMNRYSSFQSTEFHIKESTLHFVGYKWSTHHNIKIYSDNGIIINDATQSLTLDLVSFINSEFITSFEHFFQELRLSHIQESSFKCSKNLCIGKFIVDCDFKFNLQAKLLQISEIITEKEGSTLEIGESPLIVRYIDPGLGKIICNELQLYKYVFEIDQDGKTGVIEAKKVNIIKDQIEKVVINRSSNLNPEKIPEFVPLFRIAENIDEFYKSLYPYTIDPIFPCKLTVKDGALGIAKAELLSGRSLNLCFSDDPDDNCTFETYERISDHSVTSIKEVLKGRGLPDYVYNLSETTLCIANNMETELIFDTDIAIATLKLASQRRGKFELKNDLKNVHTADIRGADINGNSFLSTNLIMFEVDFRADLAAAKFGGIQLRCDEYTYRQLKEIPRPKRLEIYTQCINFTKTTISPNVPIDGSVIVAFYNVERVNGGQGGFEKNFTAILYPAKVINFTTNSYGGLYFTVISNLVASKKHYSETVDIYYKAVLPLDIKNNPNTEFRLHPNFLGESITMGNSFCGKNMNVSLAGMERIKFSGTSLMCGRSTVNLHIPNTVEMKSSKLSGNIYVPSLTIDRKIYLNEGTYLRVDEFSNPDDDFLLYFTWTLASMPFFHIDHFSDQKSSSFDPSIQTFAVPMNSSSYREDAEFFMSHDVYNFGIPFVCIYDTEYKGYVFSDGLIFKVNGTTPNATAVFNKVGMESAGDVCSYLIPYRPEPPHVAVKGPENPVPWFVICAVCSCLFLALIALVAVSFLRGFGKKKDTDVVSELEQPALMMDLINTT